MKIRELLSDKSKWTRGCTARDKDGLCVPAASDSAVQWCLYGAAIKCYGNESPDILDKLHAAVSELTYKDEDNCIMWQDRHEFKDIRALVEKLDI